MNYLEAIQLALDGAKVKPLIQRVSIRSGPGLSLIIYQAHEGSYLEFTPGQMGGWRWQPGNVIASFPPPEMINCQWELVEDD